MARFNTKVLVNRSSDWTFQCYLDENLMQHWVSGFKGIDIIRGNPREPQSLYRMIIQFNGKELEVYQKLLHVEHGELLLVEMEHPELITHSEIFFKAIGSATELECRVKVTGKRMKAKLAMPFVKSLLETRNAKDYRVFKEVVERMEH